MHRYGTTIEIYVNIYTTNLPSKPSPRKPKYGNKWKICETDLLTILSVICGVETEH
jgi:hypothetical protein